MRFVLAALIIGWAGLAQAQDVRQPRGACKSEADIAQSLQIHHNEYTGLEVLSRHGYLLKFYADTNDGSWTIVRISPTRCAGILDSGDYYRWLGGLYGPPT